MKKPSNRFCATLEPNMMGEMKGLVTLIDKRQLQFLMWGYLRHHAQLCFSVQRSSSWEVAFSVGFYFTSSALRTVVMYG